MVSIVGWCVTSGLWASGTVPSPPPSFGFHWLAPAGLLTSSHSWPKRMSKNELSHFVGVFVQAPSRPLVIASSPAPVPFELLQPRPCCSSGAASGSGPTYLSGSAAPCVLPKVWPPAISATVSSSFIAMRANVSRMSTAAAARIRVRRSGPRG